ncbi:helicase-related protein [Enterovibrio nigricans]|uniref:DEAD/DEAH box helicase n=1 Tax=Enterovibrio nigricans DSM 22720 TaxID=1121868 RepID=A0A1T4UL88_9GAMM|nr:helicase-related protein [Enterovibrio nigricans]PKF50749.1 ATP-dependent RNA helicase [Enterovibrio nigricans]SKA53444.1 DEAD/DEAH box helicase [Enterovibrio nigricans DSM 22720]
MTTPTPLKLPLDPLKSDVESTIQTRNIIVQADTGTGKSTRLPVWAMSLGKVLVVEPRRVACTSLASFVAESLGCDVGSDVGYAIKFDYCFNENTNIIFATPGVVLRWFSEDKLAQFQVVMIDEFHERRAETDLLAALLLKNDKHRLMITSATLDSDRLSHYFDADVLKANVESYGVTVSYHARDSQFMPNARDIEQRLVPVAETAIERGGDVLVFLPGKKEINTCQGLLKHLDADVIPLHASVSDADRKRALEMGERQRVVLATNVAETSLTIPGVVTVIDTGLERRTHQRNGRTALALHAISQASAKQRAGRAGRITAGFCEKLYGAHAPLELFTPPELEREDLIETMLAAACCGYCLDELAFLSSLPEKSLKSAKERLLNMRSIDDEGHVTEHGRLLYPLPIDSIFAHLITGMTTKSNREAMCDLAAVLQTPMRVWQRQSGDLAFDAYKEWNSTLCDVVTSVAVIRGEQPDEVVVDTLALNEARVLSASLREALGLPQWEAASRFDRERFLRNVIEASAELIYVRREKRQQAFGNGSCEVVLSRDSDFPADPQAAIVFDQFHLAGKGSKQTTSYATCLAPISFKWIGEAGLGEWVVVEHQKRDGVLLDCKQRVYAGRVIETTQQQAEGQGLILAMCHQILNGELFPGVGAELIEAVAYWNLFQQFEAKQPEPTIDVSTWLCDRLIALGIESQDDIELIDEKDLTFEGIPDWELKDFVLKYPLRLTLAELHVSVEYNKIKRTVIVHHEKGSRKDGPKRWELPQWKGWKIQYKKASRVITII